MRDEETRKVVREGYARIAKRESSCCGPASTCGCTDLQETKSKKIGYTDEDITSVPEGADLGLGCGNPVALASLRGGETVLDLGSGAGFDCFLAANKVGETGRIIGVDMTPEMIEKARENAWKGNYENVEFRLGEIENLPAADNSVDIVISNCVINLAPDKRRVFREAFRVLKPGGRLMVSDIVLLKELPDSITKFSETYIACLSGALIKDEYLGAIEEAGFQEVSVISEEAKMNIEDLKISSGEKKEVADSARSIKVQGVKPN